MALTNERAEKFADFLKEDVERANQLVEMSPEEVVEIANAAGNDFTVEEVTEFGDNFKAIAAQSEELNEENLDGVSGGIAAAAAAVYLTCVGLGITLGSNAAKKLEMVNNF